jgi:hypothetical protein
MKGVLIFKLPEERQEFETAQNGWIYKARWEEIYSRLRRLTKHTDKDGFTVDELRELLLDIEREYEIGEE